MTCEAKRTIDYCWEKAVAFLTTYGVNETDFFSLVGYPHNPYNGVICNDTITATGVFSSKQLWRLAKGTSNKKIGWFILDNIYGAVEIHDTFLDHFLSNFFCLFLVTFSPYFVHFLSLLTTISLLISHQIESFLTRFNQFCCFFILTLHCECCYPRNWWHLWINGPWGRISAPFAEVILKKSFYPFIGAIQKWLNFICMPKTASLKCETPLTPRSFSELESYIKVFFSEP